jgi:arylsulfatase
LTVPHLALQVPQDSLQEYEGAFPETPYKGEKGYLPHWAPRAAYAAMITRMDREIGRLMALLQELGLNERTLVLFSSDNGATIDVGGADTDFFESNAPLRGKKTMVTEGGIRVPLIARWPGRIKPGRATGHICAFEDYLPTFCEAAGVKPPPDSDGVSFLPTLLGTEKRQRKRDFFYWEFQGQQVVRRGDWKGIRNAREGTFELYNLAEDLTESRDLAAKEPAIVREIEEIMRAARTESELFPLLNTAGA